MDRARGGVEDELVVVVGCVGMEDLLITASWSVTSISGDGHLSSCDPIMLWSLVVIWQMGILVEWHF